MTTSEKFWPGERAEWTNDEDTAVLATLVAACQDLKTKASNERVEALALAAAEHADVLASAIQKAWPSLGAPPLAPLGRSISPHAAYLIATAVLEDGAEFFLADLAAYIRRKKLDRVVGAAAAIEMIEAELADRGNE